MSDIGSIIVGLIVFIVCVAIIGGIIYAISKALQPEKPSRIYEKTITIAKKIIDIKSYTVYSTHQFGDAMIQVPHSADKAHYFFEGADRMLYKTNKEIYNRVNEGDTIDVQIYEYKNDNNLYVVRLLGFKQ